MNKKIEQRKCKAKLAGCQKSFSITIFQKKKIHCNNCRNELIRLANLKKKKES